MEGDEPGECTDDADNDRDGLFDCDDPDCAGSAAFAEGDSDSDSDSDSDTDAEADTDADADADTDTDTDTDTGQPEDDPDEAVPGDPHYKVDQFGYLPDEPKVAVISQAQWGQFAPDDFTPGGTLEVLSYPEGAVLLSGSPQAWGGGSVDSLNGDMGWWFDFSELAEPGRYRLHDPDNGLYSHVFRIDDDVYRGALVAASRSYFYQREAFAKEEPWADARWTDEAAFTKDASARYVHEPDNAALERDVSGGWMDAGDANKYVNYVEQVIHVLLASYRESPEVWGEDHGIPESGNGVPDLLDEIAYEIAWLQRMQDDDGGVFIKAGDDDFYQGSPPSSHDHQRYYDRKCSSSTINLASTFAHTALVFRDVSELEESAEELEQAAVAAWDWYQANPRSADCDGLDIMSSDSDMDLDEQARVEVQAALWLYALTGDESYHQHFQRYYQLFWQLAWDWWAPYWLADEEAALFYTTLPGAEPSVVAAILASKAGSLAMYPEFYGWSAADNLYRVAMPDWSFHWGHNQVRANTGTLNTNTILYGLDPANDQSYRQRALDLLHWFHGVNPLGKVMLSNMEDDGAEDSVTEFYHLWFADGGAWDSTLDGPGPAPGYLVGGPNADYSGGVSPPLGEPPEKCYADFNGGSPDNSWEVTENSIYGQAAYLRLLASFASQAP